MGGGRRGWDGGGGGVKVRTHHRGAVAERTQNMLVSELAESSELFFSFFFFYVPQLYLWGSPLLGEIFAYVTVF